MSKTGFVSQMGNDTTKVHPRDVLVDESKQHDIENLGDCLRALGDGQSLGDFSLTIVMTPRINRTSTILWASSAVFLAMRMGVYLSRPTTNSMRTSRRFPETTRKTCASSTCGAATMRIYLSSLRSSPAKSAIPIWTPNISRYS